MTINIHCVFLFVIGVLIIISLLYCDRCITKTGGAAIGSFMPLSLGEKHQLEQFGPASEQKDYLWNFTDSYVGNRQSAASGGENPQLFDKGELTYRGSYYPKFCYDRNPPEGVVCP